MCVCVCVCVVSSTFRNTPRTEVFMYKIPRATRSSPQSAGDSLTTDDAIQKHVLIDRLI